MANALSYELNEAMIVKLGQECAPDAVGAAFAEKLGNKRDAAAVDAAGKEVFGAYGGRLIKRALELGEEHTDQTYENLKAAATKTGRLFFPHVAQRFLEIAVLATQETTNVDIVENSHYRLAHRMGPDCVVYRGLRAACGDEVAAQLPCRHACVTMLTDLYESLQLDVSVAQEAEMSKDGQCRFAGTNNRPLEPTPRKR